MYYLSLIIIIQTPIIEVEFDFHLTAFRDRMCLLIHKISRRRKLDIAGFHISNDKLLKQADVLGGCMQEIVQKILAHMPMRYLQPVSRCNHSDLSILLCSLLRSSSPLRPGVMLVILLAGKSVLVQCWHLE
jgi:hypothetical protein